MGRIKLILAASILLLIPGQANATLITIGSLTTETNGSSEIISDSLNNREWLRWNILDDLTYEQTIAATSVGGLYADFTIATDIDATMFLSAAGFGATCGTRPLFGDTLTTCGSSTYDISVFGDNYTVFDDDAWFINTTPVTGREVGFINSRTEPSTDDIKVIWDWGPISSSDNFCCGPNGGPDGEQPITWLLYKDVSPSSVPEPSIIAVFSIGMIGLGFARRKQQPGIPVTS